MIVQFSLKSHLSPVSVHVGLQLTPHGLPSTQARAQGPMQSINAMNLTAQVSELLSSSGASAAAAGEQVFLFGWAC